MGKYSRRSSDSAKSAYKTFIDIANCLIYGTSLLVLLIGVAIAVPLLMLGSYMFDKFHGR
jgi:hypothetical protein